jgi:PAS domain S-box-containing protein
LLPFETGTDASFCAPKDWIMTPDDLYRRYQELQQYVGWNEEDALRVQSVAALLGAYLPPLIDDFYEEIERHPEARKVITGGPSQIERLKGTLRAWLRELLFGPYDQDYVVRRWRVGWRHVEIGLDQVYANVALSRLRRGLLRALEERWQGDSREGFAVRRSLNTLLDLDLAIIEDAYQAEYAEAEIVRLNKDLQHRVNELQTLLDVIPIGIAIAQDPECRHIRANPALAKLLGVRPDTNVSLSAPPPESPDFKAHRNGRELAAEELPMQLAAARGMEVRDVEIDIVHPHGEIVHFLSYAAPLLDEQGRTRGAVGAFLDITERKRAQERTLQTERLAAIGQMMTGLAHESGNALARSQSCLEMLAWEVEDRPEALDLISRIQKAQDHLRQLYEEVRGYAAPLKLERETWDLSTVWRQAWENLAVQRQGRDAVLREQISRLDLHCPVDQFRLEQVFRNILENSLAACSDPVRIEVCCAEAEIGGRAAVRVTVRDNGPGLSSEQRRRIFDPFFTTKTKGTGLGMAIAKRIVETHGGQINVAPSSGAGAEIVIELRRESQ